MAILVLNLPSKEMKPTVRAIHISHLLTLIEMRGGDTVALLKSLGLKARALDDPAHRVPSEKIGSLLLGAAIQLKDPLLGLHMGDAATPAVIDSVGYAVTHSPTIGDAFDIVIRSARYQNEAFHCSLQTQDRNSTFIVSFIDPDAEAARHLSERALAHVVHWIAGLTGVDFKPVEIRFPHNRNQDRKEYQRVLKAPVSFNQHHYAVVFDPAILSVRLPEANLQLGQILQHHLDQALAAMPMLDNLMDAVRREVAANLTDGPISMPVICEKLGMSPRTCQRKLREEGLTWNKLIEQLRKNIAMQYLSGSGLPAYEVSYLLGFSDQAAFNRAFKRWTGVTPGKYRQQLKG